MKIPTVADLKPAKEDLSEGFFPLVKHAYDKRGSHEMTLTLEDGYTAKDVRAALQEASKKLPEERSIRIKDECVKDNDWKFTISVVDKIRRPRKKKKGAEEA